MENACSMCGVLHAPAALVTEEEDNERKKFWPWVSVYHEYG
jgi:hypothetical protein